ncbi:hypothetical protein ACSBM8_18530 [Sphingomonas sp. ASY06-1R]|uniref:hypothetical protein n=1 Tax=Sphingomonas sp. ASY06-1R TaxID=3445771 RepID=UPI003FA2EEAB
MIAAHPAGAAPGLPAELTRQLPAGYAVLGKARIVAGQPNRTFVIVALGRRTETKNRALPAPARPLLIFALKDHRYVLAGRNDHVVLRADEGGQCDPFLDGNATIATRGRYFTVENGVACGQHWTDYITFRLDDRTGGFVFDNERTESWSMNLSPVGDALVRDGPPSVRRDRPGKITPFARWRPRD